MTVSLISVSADQAVRVISHNGFYMQGTCIACGGTGDLVTRHGYRSDYNSIEKLSRNPLIHQADCPMNEVIDKAGNLTEI